MDSDAVPDLVRRLWRLPITTPTRMGRKSTLDVETVIAAAVRLADAEGLAAATLPKVSEQLGVTAMSLYRHVGSKDDLLQLMLDAASDPPAGPAETTGWREGLWRWALDLWELYRRRPWLPRVPLHRTPSGPNQIAWLERGLEALADTRLGWDEKARAVTLLSGYVRHSIQLTQDLEEGRPAEQAQAAGEHEYARALGRLVTAQRFPNTAAMLASEAFAASDEPTDVTAREDFTAGLALLLDGLEAQIATTSGATHRRDAAADRRGG